MNSVRPLDSTNHGVSLPQAVSGRLAAIISQCPLAVVGRLLADEAVLTARPASTTGEPTTPAPDCLFNIEFTGWSRVEAILDFGPHPAKLLTAALLMQDCGDDGGLAAAIPALAYLRRNELLEGGWEFYGDDRRHHLSIEDMGKPANQGDRCLDQVGYWPRFVPYSANFRVS
jgi:hypothetical protein